MASRALNHVFGFDRSLSGKAWHWRGGNMDVSASGTGAQAANTSQITGPFCRT